VRPNFCVTDMTHFLDEHGRLADMPAPARGLARHLAAIVTAVTRRRPGVRWIADVRCGGGRVGGPVRVGSAEWSSWGSGALSWRCPACGDGGLIHHWADTPWDGGAAVDA
jgi:hypothetical protein